MDYGRKSLLAAKEEAVHNNNPSDLDLAIRALLHYGARGFEIDTTAMKFPEVLVIDPKFYG